jgi:hypothetical protein
MLAVVTESVNDLAFGLSGPALTSTGRNEDSSQPWGWRWLRVDGVGVRCLEAGADDHRIVLLHGGGPTRLASASTM